MLVTTHPCTLQVVQSTQLEIDVFIHVAIKNIIQDQIVFGKHSRESTFDDIWY